ncbi:MAG: hypothetical protein O3B70_05420 [Bacteroidetes bacterium]|nr:hypothetical protein [Bacteroidota bacterium]MDA0903758.1 hypothetical protein [Bacteroidota bacterium]MDA1242562.1 hypothetical protein [Bacteroidota bacterium]
MRYSLFFIALCWASMAQAQTTFHVDMTCAPAGFSDVFVTGPWCGWCANDVYNTMTDPDGDGIYSVTLDETVTGLIEYKYAINGFADQENLVNDMVAGATCAPITDYNGYANRTIHAGSVANDYYGSCDGVCNDAPPVDITFQVDMTQYAGSFTTVNLNGSFNGWCGGCAVMTDADADSIYVLTVTMQPDTIEYKFTVDGWTGQEEFAGGEACTSTIGGFTNRSYVATSSATLDPVCWNSCDACATEQPQERAITFRVDMNEVASVNPIGVFIAGTFQGWQAGATPMDDSDGDGIWEHTAMVLEGETIQWKYLNGPNWGLEETVPPACGNAVDNFNRSYTVGGADEVLPAVCFGACLPCGTVAETVDVTFTVLTDNIEVAADGMFIAGAMNGWSGEAMSDNGDGSWSITKTLEAANYEFKFQNGNGGWEELDCGGNRSVQVVVGSPIAVQGCFGQCAEVCAIDPDPADVTFQVDASQIVVDSSGMYLIGSFTTPAWQFGAIAMDDTDGDGIWTATVNVAGPASFQYKFNNGPAVVDSVAVYDGEENADFIAAGCGVNNGVGGSNRVHERSGSAEVLNVVCFNSCEACVAAPSVLVATVDVCAAMPSSVRMTGPFWGWDPGAGPVASDNGNGTWSVTFDPAPEVDMEYLWIVDGVQENLIGAGDCTPVTDGASYANRLWVAGADDISDVFNTCGACDGGNGGGGTVFNVDMCGIDAAGSTVNGTTSFTDVFVTGPWCGWCANDGYNELTDPDGDGIFSVEIADLTGVVEYKYGINGFADQEQLVDDMVAGASCAPVTDYAGYANRSTDAGSINDDTFGSCTSCADQTPPANVTFRVDMSQYSGTFGTVNLNGSFNGWCGTCTEMIDNGNGVYEVTLTLATGTVEYKFTLDGWNVQEEFVSGTACTSTIDGFTNRTLTISEDVVLEAVCWNECAACQVVVDVEGCTSPFFTEFDPYATIDDGSCGTAIVLGCTYEAALNYNQFANTDDGSCEFDPNQGNDCPADLDGDGSVTTTDLLSFLASFGSSCL